MDCLVTKLKGSVSNESLPIFDTLVIHVSANPSASTAAKRLALKADTAGLCKVTVTSGGGFSTTPEGPYNMTEDNIPTLIRVYYFSSENDYDIIITGKYHINEIQMSQAQLFSLNLDTVDYIYNLDNFIISYASIGSIDHLKNTVIKGQLDGTWNNNILGSIDNLKTGANVSFIGFNGSPNIRGELKNLIKQMCSTKTSGTCELKLYNTAVSFNGSAITSTLTATFSATGATLTETSSGTVIAEYTKATDSWTYFNP